MRFLTEALHASLQQHGRIEADGDRAIVHLLGANKDVESGERLSDELIPCRVDEDEFEPRLKAVLRRHYARWRTTRYAHRGPCGTMQQPG